MSSIALFETIRVRGGMLPFLERHLVRLASASRLVGLADPPVSLRDEAIARARDGVRERGLRLEWDGHAPRWEERDPAVPGPLRMVTVTEPHPGYPVKAVARAAFDRALGAAERAGADEPLLLTREGDVAEAARFAFVWLEGEVLRVPDPELGVLPSVGLARVLELAAGRGLPVVAGWFPRKALDGRPAVLVNALRGVIPVAFLDGVQVPVSQELTALAADFWPPA